MVPWRSGPVDSRGAGGSRSEEDRFSFSSCVEVVDASRLSLALELAVVPRYPSRDAPCWTADTALLLWVLEVTSDWLKTEGQKLKADYRSSMKSYLFSE